MRWGRSIENRAISTSVLLTSIELFRFTLLENVVSVVLIKSPVSLADRPPLTSVGFGCGHIYTHD